jgi:uncharacterized membrane protein YdjX (TVP38/TMEM64 family)
VVGVIVFSPIREMITAQQLSLLIQQLQDEPLAPLYYVILYIVCVIFALPGVMLTIFAGPIFGLWKGILLVLLGANIGCQITFFLSRLLGREVVTRFVKGEGVVEKLSKRIEKNGFLVILSLRLLPIFPFNIINYVSGLTSLRYRDYTVGTLLGMIPGTSVYVYLSYSATQIKDNPWELGVALGLLLIFIVVLTFCKKKFKSLDEDR